MEVRPRHTNGLTRRLRHSRPSGQAWAWETRRFPGEKADATAGWRSTCAGLAPHSALATAGQRAVSGWRSAGSLLEGSRAPTGPFWPRIRLRLPHRSRALSGPPCPAAADALRPQLGLAGRGRCEPGARTSLARRRRGDNPTVWERVGEALGATKLSHPLHTAGSPALCCPVPFISCLSAPLPAIARASFRTQSFRSGSNQHFNPKVRSGPKYAEADHKQNSHIENSEAPGSESKSRKLRRGCLQSATNIQ